MISFWICFVLPFALADLRCASQPKQAYKVQQRNRNVPFQKKFALYMEPSDFMYQGLKNQRDGGGYDNFLRSNIDNEQDRRNFNTEDGKDHLPFRTYETSPTDVGQATQVTKMVPAANVADIGVTEAGDIVIAKVGEHNIAPLRWNNPHSAELEMNIWIMKEKNGAARDIPLVVPIMYPTCSGEGYQDNVYRWRVPADFNTKFNKVCAVKGDCVLQMFAQSVESRMYANGVPLVVTPNDDLAKAYPTAGDIKEPKKDVGFDLAKLRRLCLPRAGKIDYETTTIYKARLTSDVYNHAYQNSDYSPYAGQQPDMISQNMQAACILKMTATNFGELGKKYMQKEANEARLYANKLDKKARGLVRTYETTTNSIIKAIEKSFYSRNVYGLESWRGTMAENIGAGSTMCTEWRDQWDRVVGGRPRGVDRTGGYCKAGYACKCKGDCYLGYGKGDQERDAYCAKLVAADCKNKADEVGQNNCFVDAPGFDSNSEEAKRIPLQATEVCFRCAETGSTKTNRQNTNTYIPSFEIRGVNNVNEALLYVAPMYLKSGFLTNPKTGKVSKKGDNEAILQIYMAVLTDMWAEFRSATTGSYLKEKYPNKYNQLVKQAKQEAGVTDKEAACETNPACKAALEGKVKKYTFNFRSAMVKNTIKTMPDANGGEDHEFKKLDAAGNQDGGYYSAKKAYPLHRKGDTDFDVPDSQFALNSNKVRQTNNIAPSITFKPEDFDPKKMKYQAFSAMESQPDLGEGVTFKFPPDEEEEDLCNDFPSIADPANMVTTEEQLDMDGLNYDADCDQDKLVEKAHKAHEDDCAAQQAAGILAEGEDFVYECPNFEEPVCVIPGQGGILPGQMFTNGPGAVIRINAAKSTAVPSAVIALVSVLVASML